MIKDQNLLYAYVYIHVFLAMYTGFNSPELKAKVSKYKNNDVKKSLFQKPMIKFQPKHPWVKEIWVCSKCRDVPFSRGMMKAT